MSLRIRHRIRQYATRLWQRRALLWMGEAALFQFEFDDELFQLP